MIIYVDIDETICFYENEREYGKALPIKENIAKINELFDAGNKVIYWTARGSVTGIDWTDTTEQQLNRWGAKHHELKLGKPHYDIFVCDKAINTKVFFEEGNKSEQD